MMKYITLCMAITFFSTSCATILNRKHQRITINAPQDTQISINHEAHTGESYVAKRDMLPKQVVVSKEGYQDRNYALMQSKKSPIYILSIVPFAALLYPPVYDYAPNT